MIINIKNCIKITNIKLYKKIKILKLDKIIQIKNCIKISYI